MNQLAEQGVIGTPEVPGIVSLHNLVVFSRTMDHPAQFLEFLRRRPGRKLATMVVGVDELDMLMWFMTGGVFFEPDPAEVSAQIPCHDGCDRPRSGGSRTRGGSISARSPIGSTPGSTGPRANPTAPPPSRRAGRNRGSRHTSRLADESDAEDAAIAVMCRFLTSTSPTWLQSAAERTHLDASW